MNRKSIFIATSTGLLIAGLSLAGPASADTCPTKLTHKANGFLVSKARPGWKSHKKIPAGVTISAKNFGGVVYSPQRKRLACVYRASNKEWVALVSERNFGISIDKEAKDSSGKNAAWQFSKKHGDYACGRPAVKGIADCKFTVK